MTIAWYSFVVTPEKPSILHVCSRDTVLNLRDEVFRINGYEVVSTLSIVEALTLFQKRSFTVVLIDVEGEGRVPEAEKLCGDIRHEKQEQKVAFLCNHRVAIESDCPDEVIRAEFNPKALVEGVRQLLA